MKKIAIQLIPVWTALGILLLWWIASLAIRVDLILPSPSETFVSLASLLTEGEFWTALGHTLIRTSLAFTVSFAVALLCALGRANAVCRRVSDCFFAFLRSVPTMSVILLLLIFLKPSGAPQAVAAIVICPTLYSAFSAAADLVEPQLMEVCRLYRVKKKDVFFRFWLPSVASGLFEGAASGFSLNLKLVISAEAIAHTVKSFGNLMQNAQIWLQTDRLIALTLTAVLLGALGEWFIRLIGRSVVRWKSR